MSLHRGAVNTFPFFPFFPLQLKADSASKSSCVCSTKLMRYKIIIVPGDCLCGLAKEHTIFVLWFLLMSSRVGVNHLQSFIGLWRGRRSLYEHIPTSKAGGVGETQVHTGEMLHETYIKKLSWTFAGSMGHAEVWSIARVCLSARRLETTALCNTWQCKCWHSPSRVAALCCG